MIRLSGEALVEARVPKRYWSSQWAMLEAVPAAMGWWNTRIERAKAGEGVFICDESRQDIALAAGLELVKGCLADQDLYLALEGATGPVALTIENLRDEHELAVETRCLMLYNVPAPAKDWEEEIILRILRRRYAERRVTIYHCVGQVDAATALLSKLPPGGFYQP